jgi:hypothetical protein
MAPTYRQIEQYPDPKSRGLIAPKGFRKIREGSVLLVVVDSFIIKGCNYKVATFIKDCNHHGFLWCPNN